MQLWLGLTSSSYLPGLSGIHMSCSASGFASAMLPMLHSTAGRFSRSASGYLIAGGVGLPFEVHEAVMVRVRENSEPRAAFHVRVIRAADLFLACMMELHLQVNRHQVLRVNLEHLLGRNLDKLGVIDRAVLVLQRARMDNLSNGAQSSGILKAKLAHQLHLLQRILDVFRLEAEVRFQQDVLDSLHILGGLPGQVPRTFVLVVFRDVLHFVLILLVLLILLNLSFHLLLFGEAKVEQYSCNVVVIALQHRSTSG